MIFLWSYSSILWYLLSSCYCIKLICFYLLVWLNWLSFLFIPHLVIYRDSVWFTRFGPYCLCWLFAWCSWLSHKRTCLLLAYLWNTRIMLFILVSAWLLPFCRILREYRRWLVLIYKLRSLWSCWWKLLLSIESGDRRAWWSTQWTDSWNLLCRCILFILLEHHLWLIKSNLDAV